MTSRRLGESAGGVLSFTFLDVLTCTMGSLILLVIVLGQKGKNTRLEDALKNGPRKGSASVTSIGSRTSANAPTSEEGPHVPALPHKSNKGELAQLHRQKEQLQKLREEARQRLADEEARVSHLEEHERRLEHELAQLHVALERLQSAEQKQTVDERTAQRELVRLRQVVADTEQQLQQLRTLPGGKRSYAILPYKGGSGTFRRPIYIECTGNEAIIQPEGIRISARELDGRNRSGNPIAAAIRAAREELNARAKAAGDKDLPDPYPLLLVRPDGARIFDRARDAVDGWDIQYGYELVEADWDLAYPDQDPVLSQVMMHAVQQSRSRQAALAKAAPSRFISVDEAIQQTTASRTGGNPASGRNSAARITADPNGVNRGLHAGGRGSAGLPGNGGAGGGAPPSSSRYNTVGSDAAASASKNFADQFSDTAGADGASSSGSDDALTTGSGTAPTGNGTSLTPGGSAQAGQSLANHGSRSVPGAEGGGAIGVSPGGTGQSLSVQVPDPSKQTARPNPEATDTKSDGDKSEHASSDSDSAATSRGSNWANVAARKGSPITRPIPVVVNAEQLELTTETSGDASTQSNVISFQQPTDKVLDDIADAVKQRTEDWGLAGRGMYWRPVLVLRVAPGANRHAIRIRDLLRDSGVDVRFQDVPSPTSQESSSAPR